MIPYSSSFCLFSICHRNETADAYMRLYSEDNKRVTEAVYGRKYKLRVGVNNLDSKNKNMTKFLSSFLSISSSFRGSISTHIFFFVVCYCVSAGIKLSFFLFCRNSNKNHVR